MHFKGSETQEKVTEFEVRYATVVVPKAPADSDKTGLVYMLPVQGAFFYDLRSFSSKAFVRVNRNTGL